MKSQSVGIPALAPITTPMTVLAYASLHGSAERREECALQLARLVLATGHPERVTR